MKAAEAALEREMRELYNEARGLGYRASYFLQRIQELGRLATARRLLAGHEFHEGFIRLWEMKRLDLSLEARALKPEYRALFSKEERTRARRKLAALRYCAPWDEGEESP